MRRSSSPVPFVLWENRFGGAPFQYAILWLSGDQSGSTPPAECHTRRDAASELHLPNISAAR